MNAWTARASLPRVSIGQYSTAGAKQNNDDSYGVVVPDTALLATHGIAMAIADGLSVSERAKEASEACIRSFLEDYYATHASWSVKKSVGVVLKAVNSWLYAQDHQASSSDHGMASTFSGLVLKGGSAHVFHVGDSRISLLREGRLEPLTRDHRGSLRRGQDYLTRAFGSDQNLEIDYRAEPISAGDILIFTTDGVHDYLPATEIAKQLSEQASSLDLDAIAKRFVDQAFARGSTDNLTCQLVRIDSPGLADEAGHLNALSALKFPPDLVAGQTFDGYQIVRELHASPRSQVYQAIDKGSGEVVVLKTPSVNFADDPAYIDMFAREEWLGRLVASPHVLKVMLPSRARSHLYTVTEYFEGQTLLQWMRDHPRPDFEAVRAIVDQIALGLRAFHRKDIIHQDLKPDNVMINQLGLVKIIDFGSARAAGIDDLAHTVSQPNLVGTVDYTAPEYHQGERPTNRSDIYALGVITYEMLTGKLPYGRGFANVRDLKKLTYIPAHTVRDDVPLWMDAALEKAVQIHPSERTEALSEFTENLRRSNPAIGYTRRRPLIEKYPVAFWRTLAFLSLFANLAFLVHLARR